jgi:hypothetical protein
MIQLQLYPDLERVIEMRSQNSEPVHFHSEISS